MAVRDEHMHTSEKEQEDPLDYVDACMKALGISLNFLDPNGTFKGVPDEELLTKIMNEVREDYRDLSNAILALREQ